MMASTIRRLLILLALFAAPTFAQNFIPYSDIVLSGSGRPIGGAGIAVCNTGLQATGATVFGNIATLSFLGSPAALGFATNMQLMVSGFTGTDTYLNAGQLSSGVIVGGYTILAIGPTTISFALSHANATATTNGAAFQQGNTSTPCAPLAPIFLDSLGATPIAQPGFTTDGLGNYAFYAAANFYNIQIYGSSVTLRIKPISLGGSGGPAGGSSTLFRLQLSGATPLSASDFTLSANNCWGAGAAISSVTGVDTSFTVVINTGSATCLTPAFTLTFHDGPWAQIYSVIGSVVGGSPTDISTTNNLISTTLVYNGVPQTNSTYTISATVVGASNVFIPPATVSPVVTNPIGTQTIVQPPNTNLSVNTLENIKFADQFPGATPVLQIGAAAAAFAGQPGIVIAPPGMGAGIATNVLPNNVQLWDFRQTQDIFEVTRPDSNAVPARRAPWYIQQTLGDFSVTPLQGTMTFTNGSTAVTGVGTAFTSQLNIGFLGAAAIIKLSTDSPTSWDVAAVVIDDTHLTLTTAYTGVGGTGTGVMVNDEPGPTVQATLNGGIPNSQGGGEFVGYSAFVNRTAGSRGAYGANFNVQYHTPSTLLQGQAVGVEIDLSNYSGVDSTGGDTSIGLDILSAGTNKPTVGIDILSIPNTQFITGIFIDTWDNSGSGIFGVGHQNAIKLWALGDAPAATPQIFELNATQTKNLWQINNDGTAYWGQDITTSGPGNGGGFRGYYMETNGLPRWFVSTTDGTESGANAGSDFDIVSYSDLGVDIDTPFSIARATGIITIDHQLSSTLATGTAPLSVLSTTPVTTLTVANHPKVQFCGTTTACSHTALTNAQLVIGTVALSGGTATITGISPAFTSTATFNCVANDTTTSSNAVKAVPASASSFTITGTGTDTISYSCGGN